MQDESPLLMIFQEVIDCKIQKKKKKKKKKTLQICFFATVWPNISV